MIAWTKTVGALARGLCLAASLALASCGQRGDTSSTEPTVTEPASEQVTWSAIAPTTVDAGPPVVLHLSQGYGYALLADTPVQPGDAVTARYALQGQAGRYVRIMIQRHCDEEAGDDLYAEDVLLTGEPQQGQIAMTFSRAYSCIRVSFVSNGHQQTDVTVSELTVTKTSTS